MAMQYQLEHSQWLPTAEIERRQFQQAGVLLRHALASIPHYREKYGELAIPEKLDWDYWRTLPLLERSEIQEHFERLRSSRVPPSHGQVISYGSSGSTGRPIKALGTDTTHFFWLCLSLRDHLWHGRDFEKKHAAIRSKVEQGNVAGWDEWSDSFVCGPAAMLNIQTDVDKQLDWLLAENPEYLITHPSNLHALVIRAGERRARPNNLHEVRTYGEMVKPELRELVHQAWDMPLIDIYTAEEVGYIALQCPEHEHYHIQSENLLVEVLDEQGNPCAPGEVGSVVVTTLHNFAMPLIRYRILDYAEVGDICPCGRGLPVLKRIVGRQRNRAILPDGRHFWPSFRGADWLAVAPVRQFQLVQHTVHSIEVRLVCARALEVIEEAGLRAMLTKTIGYPFTFHFTYTDRI